MRISAKRTNLGKIMISRKKPISRVKKIIKNKTNKRKTKKMKKKHKKVKHKTTRKIRSMSRIGRRRTYHGGGENFPMDTKDNTIGQGSYGLVYIPDPGKPSWVAKLHKIEKHETGCKLTGEYEKHKEALKLLNECKQNFKDIKLKIPVLQTFHYLASRKTLKEFEIIHKQEGASGCVYTMSRIWPPSQNQIKKLIKQGIDFYRRDNGPPSYLFLSWNRYWPEKSNTVLEISMLKNSYFNSPSRDSQIIEDKKIGFIEMSDGSPAFNWGYSMMLFYFYCAYNNLILRDSEFALGQEKTTGRDDIHLFCYDFNQCRPPIPPSNIDAANQYLHLSGMKIGHSKYGSQEEAESDNWKFMPIPTTSPIFFVNLVNKIFADTKKEHHREFHIYIKNVVDHILLWLFRVYDGENWKKPPSNRYMKYSKVKTDKNSELFKIYNIQNHYYFSIPTDKYVGIDVLSKAKLWTKDIDELEGDMFQITKDNMMDYIKARREKCQFGLDKLETNSPELEFDKLITNSGEKTYFYTTSPPTVELARELKDLYNGEDTFLVNINLDIDMQKTIIKKMVIDGFITYDNYYSNDDVESFLSELIKTARSQQITDGSSGFYKIIEMLDEEYSNKKPEEDKETDSDKETEMPHDFTAPGGGDDY